MMFIDVKINGKKIKITTNNMTLYGSSRRRIYIPAVNISSFDYDIDKKLIYVTFTSHIEFWIYINNLHPKKYYDCIGEYINDIKKLIEGKHELQSRR